MAIDFTNPNPSEGDTEDPGNGVTYVYTDGVWTATGGAAGGGGIDGPMVAFASGDMGPNSHCLIWTFPAASSYDISDYRLTTPDFIGLGKGVNSLGQTYFYLHSRKSGSHRQQLSLLPQSNFMDTPGDPDYYLDIFIRGNCLVVLGEPAKNIVVKSFTIMGNVESTIGGLDNVKTPNGQKAKIYGSGVFNNTNPLGSNYEFGNEGIIALL